MTSCGCLQKGSTERWTVIKAIKCCSTCATDTDRKMSDKHASPWNSAQLRHLFLYWSSTCAAWHHYSQVKCSGSTEPTHANRALISAKTNYQRTYSFLCCETRKTEKIKFSGTMINSLVLRNYRFVAGPWMCFNKPRVVKVFTTPRGAWDL